jgi:hypothetical protein
MGKSLHTSHPSAETPHAVALWKRGGAPLWISIGVHLVLLVIAVIWVWQIPAKPEKRVDFLASGKDDGGAAHSIVQRKQDSVLARSSTARIAAVDVTSHLVLPRPDDGAGLPSLPSLGSSSALGGMGGRGAGGGTGAGMGLGFASGAGKGPGGGLGPPVRFFEQEVTAKRIAYVIDFSKSMKGRRQELMRAELAKSIGQLHPTQDYQLIFFAGPVWVGGSVVRMADDQKSAVVIAEGGAEHEWTSINVGNWEMSGRKQEASWLRADKTNLHRSISIISETELVYGTYWKPAIELALAMQPPPEVVYFMTDGIVSKKVYETIDELSRTARRRGTIINTISMMEPDAADAMRALAKQSGGAFTMVNADGSSTASNSKN